MKKFSVMLGTSIENCTIPKDARFSISQKLNGVRAVYYKGKIYSRCGIEYSGLGHILDDVNTIYGNSETVLDCELVYKNDDGLSDIEAFQKGVGIARSKSADKRALELVVFDIITTAEFDRGYSDSKYSIRRQSLQKLNEAIKAYGICNIKVVDMFYYGTDQRQIGQWLEYAENHDMEGIMINLDEPYVCKRTRNLIKVKRFHTVDLRIIGYKGGEGKFAGTLGALIVDYKGNEVSVGSGMDDTTRAILWDYRESLIGNIAEVKYKEVTRNKKTGKESLQFPSFVSIRTDKTNVSYE